MGENLFDKIPESSLKIATFKYVMTNILTTKEIFRRAILVIPKAMRKCNFYFHSSWR